MPEAWRRVEREIHAEITDAESLKINYQKKKTKQQQQKKKKKKEKVSYMRTAITPRVRLGPVNPPLVTQLTFRHSIERETLSPNPHRSSPIIRHTYLNL